jgi:HD-GYP domain-containing protein (c-di-GMP phosphodiesterase class II)
MLGVISLRHRFADQEIVDRLAERSTRCSMLGVVMSLAGGQSVEATSEVGLAGLLHDTALLSHPEWFSSSTPHDDKYIAEYRRHPIESAELLNGIEGISRSTILLITQVHEQADGTGYPRGLRIEQTLKGASLLNLADAYLALTSPLQGKQLAPADAMAYLCYQTALGKFSKDALQYFLQNMSIYPIGSTVTLDDETNAVVVEGGTGKPLQPVVRLLGTGNLRIDLSASSRFISGPYMIGEQGSFERIQKQQMQQVLWRTDY